jgi:hypothetical protein
VQSRKLEAQTRSIEHLECSIEGLDEALHRGFITGIKIAQFNILKSGRLPDHPEAGGHGRQVGTAG